MVGGFEKSSKKPQVIAHEGLLSDGLNTTNTLPNREGLESW